jgi:CRISPR-associated exonuclease Cas4
MANTPYSEDDLLPISALQHLAFCERQWALIHLEQQWAENQLTAQGRNLHERAHEGPSESRDGARICRGLRLRSMRLGLAGQADVVEFRRVRDAGETVFPIEYKRGKPKPARWDEVQLCAQALCLEEMLGVAVNEGAIFYGQPRRRMNVSFVAGLRSETEQLAARLHELQSQGITPPAVQEPKCQNCSLRSLCLPSKCSGGAKASRYIHLSIQRSMEEK